MADITGVYNDDFHDNQEDILWLHGCYVYRLLHDLKICGQNTKETFSRLLGRCCTGQNAPMCHVVVKPSDDEVMTPCHVLQIF